MIRTSPLIVLRTLVLLAALVIVPLVALFGGSLPSWLHGRTATKAPAADRLSGGAPMAADAARMAPATPVPATSPPSQAARGRSEPPPSAPPPAASDDGPVLAMLQELQELGALYYRLDREGEGYVFHCRMDGVNAPFSSSAATATDAIRRVVEQVESWRLARRAAGAQSVPETARRRDKAAVPTR